MPIYFVRETEETSRSVTFETDGAKVPISTLLNLSEYIRFTGPIYIGSVLSWFLCGSFMVQLYEYYLLYQENDQRFIKFIVYFVFVAEIAQLIMMNHTVWYILVEGYGNPAYIHVTPWSSVSAPVLNGITSATVQIFFAWRIWMLGRHRASHGLSVFISLVSIMGFAASLATTIQFGLIGRQPEHLHAIKPTVIIWHSASFLCDVLIAASMVTTLSRTRRKASFRNTERVINALVVNTVETGAVTAVVALLDLVFFLTGTDNFLFVCMEYLLGRIFSNVLLATLNGRRRLRNMNDEYGTSLSRTVDPIRFGDMTGRSQSRSLPEGVHISTEVHVDSSSEGRKGYTL
ncbi:hypothetical protein Hypma_012652 [Hypsizygus marmoreus]|uniref:DUF6534 domain-containing protein n=1 Tax=Hypsizygus marmoreus TaxID=39966 RepID=A0A369JLR9_HYPMA|nr:hypothetical protein Hypma_012652 [Hypsizygus marmoreus]